MNVNVVPRQYQLKCFCGKTSTFAVVLQSICAKRHARNGKRMRLLIFCNSCKRECFVKPGNFVGSVRFDRSRLRKRHLVNTRTRAYKLAS